MSCWCLGWAYSTQAGLTASRAHPHPSSPQDLLGAILGSEFSPWEKVAFMPCPSCAWQDWDNCRLSLLCSGEIPALTLQISSAPSMDGLSSFADFGTC